MLYILILNAINIISDIYTRVKLRLVFLQCSLIDVIPLTNKNNSNTSVLMFTLVKLIAQYNLLEQIIRIQLINSSLGREFSEVQIQNVQNVSIIQK